jgi:penicillin-binding protein 2
MLGESLSDFITVRSKPFSNTRSFSPKVSGDFRLVLVKLGSIAVFLILFASLIKTQLMAGQYYRNLADGNRIRIVPVHAPRGIIFDRNNVPLTANLPSFRVGDQEISKNQAIVLEANLPAGRQVPEVSSARVYLKGETFAHLLGYISGFEGKDGIEKFYQDKLKGKDGKELVEVDATGQKLRVISTVDPIPGENLVLTVDESLQKTAYENLNGKKGAIIVTKPSTGEILALVSSPSFNPNIFSDISLPLEERTDGIAKLFSDLNQPIFNRAIAGTYPPGSTFKLVTATAGLETGAIKGDTLIEDTGVLVVGPYKFPNWKWLAGGGVEGMLNVSGAIQKSNDIFFYQVGERTGIDNLMSWARIFGLGAKLGVDLPGEVSGLVQKTPDWYLGDTYHWAIGQGDLLVTPLQDNTWTNVIANGGKLCVPHVYGPAKCHDLGIKKETIDLIKKGMMAACSPGGTGYPLFDFTPQVYCKTGTAEFGTQDKTHAWFTAFSGDISITVLVEGAGEGSDVAAPIARKIFEKWFSK